MLEDPMTKSKSRKSSKSQGKRSKQERGRMLKSGIRKTASQNAIRRSRAAVPTSVATNATSRPDTKQAQVIAMLCAPSGTTIDAMMRLTGWQQHSVRGFLTAVVRKKLGFELRSEPSESGRVYRINARGTTPVVDTTAKTAA